MTGTEMLTVLATSSECPALVARDRWPLHVTVAGNFRLDDSGDIPQQVRLIASETRAFCVRLGPPARFGAEQDISVLLAEHPTFHLLHEVMARRLTDRAGFSAAEPAFWNDGYRPHATLGPAVTCNVGDVMAIRWLTLAVLRGNAAHVKCGVQLS